MKQIKFDKEAREKLLSGVEILEKAVSSTLGAKGRNVIFESGNRHVVTKDGVTVAKQVVSDDPIEQAAIDIVREAASRTASEAGDGTTTATVIASALIKKALQHIGNGANPMDVKRGIDLAVSKVIEYIDKMSKEVNSYDDIKNIATISANNDPEMGKLVADMFDVVGKDGAIRIEETQMYETTVDTIEGCNFINGFLHPAFINKKSKGTADYEDVMILLTDKNINESFNELVPALNIVVEEANSQNKNIALLIICGGMEGEPLGTLTVNRVQRQFPVVAVNAPEFGEERAEMLDDLAVITGGTVISEAKGFKLEEITADQFGRADRVIVDKDYTTIIGRKGEADKIEERVELIKHLQSEDKQNSQAWRLEKRLAMLTGGIGVVYVGGRSEQEMKDNFFRLEDSLSATKAALQDGYVPGGGLVYMEASKSLNAEKETRNMIDMAEAKDLMLLNIEFPNHDQEYGYNAVISALNQPIIKMADNAGENGQIVLATVLSKESGIGYNTLTDSYEDLVKAGVIDPVKVAKAAVQNAASVAGMVITTNCVITPKPKD